MIRAAIAIMALTTADDVNASSAFSLTIDASKYLPLILMVSTIFGAFLRRQTAVEESE